MRRGRCSSSRAQGGWKISCQWEARGVWGMIPFPIRIRGYKKKEEEENKERNEDEACYERMSHAGRTARHPQQQLPVITRSCKTPTPTPTPFIQFTQITHSHFQLPPSNPSPPTSPSSPNSLSPPAPSPKAPKDAKGYPKGHPTGRLKSSGNWIATLYIMRCICCQGRARMWGEERSWRGS